jgi:hypothetical protein
MDKQFLGVELGHYVMIIITGIPVFFFWCWVYRRRTSTVKRRTMTWLGTIITAPILYVVLIMTWIMISEYYPNRDFDKMMWQTNKDERYEYTHDLIKSKILLGKTRDQVLNLLGDDADTSQIDELGYDIGFRPELTGIDPSYLIIDFKNGKVDTLIEQDK